MPRLRTFGVCALLLSGSAAAEHGAALRAWLGTGYDTNAHRDFVDPAGTVGVAPEADAMLSGLASGEAFLEGPRARLTGAYDLGGRKFLRVQGEDVLIQGAVAQGAVALAPGWVVSLEGRGKDRRGGSRDYTDLSSALALAWSPTASLELSLSGGPHRFVYWDQFRYSFWAPEGQAQATLSLSRRHRLLAFASWSGRRYNDTPNQGGGPGARREDQVLGAGAGYAYRGPLSLSLTYAYLEQASNSFGESVLRHRLSLAWGLRLFWKLTLLGQAQGQLSYYPQGISFGSDLNVGEDEDLHNSVSLKLVRPVSAQVDLELRYGLYQNRLPQTELLYLRQVASFGVSWRL